MGNIPVGVRVTPFPVYNDFCLLPIPISSLILLACVVVSAALMNATELCKAPDVQDRSKHTHLVEAVLPLYHHAQVLVVKDEHFDVQLLDGCRRHLLAVHQEAAVTVNVHHHLPNTNPVTYRDIALFRA